MCFVLCVCLQQQQLSTKPSQPPQAAAPPAPKILHPPAPKILPLFLSLNSTVAPPSPALPPGGEGRLFPASVEGGLGRG